MMPHLGRFEDAEAVIRQTGVQHVMVIAPGLSSDAVQDIAAVGALGLIGEASDAALVRAALNKGGSRLRPAAETALKRIAEREGGAVK